MWWGDDCTARDISRRRVTPDLWCCSEIRVLNVILGWIFYGLGKEGWLFGKSKGKQWRCVCVVTTDLCVKGSFFFGFFFSSISHWLNCKRNAWKVSINLAHHCWSNLRFIGNDCYCKCDTLRLHDLLRDFSQWRHTAITNRFFCWELLYIISVNESFPTIVFLWV